MNTVLISGVPWVAHVYLACKPDNPHDKFVVKVFDIPSSEDDVDDERDQLRVFARNEYSIASRLSHPNIVRQHFALYSPWTLKRLRYIVGRDIWTGS